MDNTCSLTFKKIFINTIIIGIVASFSHFAYDLSGQKIIVGLFNPVNESVWEHLKFMFFPLLLWWVVIYLIKRKKCDIPIKNWIVSAAISLITAPLFVVFLYYSYTGAFGIESVIIDILLVFICFFIALSIAAHYLKFSEPAIWLVITSVIAVAVIFTAFIVFTFNPPHLPIFYDTVTNMYGI